MKRFKHYKDLIRYAVRRAIHRVDVLEPETQANAERLVPPIKETDWLQWAARKLKERVR